ncbi:MAG: hypothetical protein J6D04_01935 [Clostridia bacterium]|nr:hypothetical protein [Clostridia bacterium]
MALATRGSSAYQLEVVEPTTTQAPKRSAKSAKATQAKLKKRVAFGIVAAFVIAFGLACRFAVLTDINAEVNALEKELTLLQGQNKQTELAIEQSYDLKTVEEIAITKLGMSRPSKAQITYISMNSADYAEVIGAQEPSAWLSRLANGVLAYLR